MSKIVTNLTIEDNASPAILSIIEHAERLGKILATLPKGLAGLQTDLNALDMSSFKHEVKNVDIGIEGIKATVANTQTELDALDMDSFKHGIKATNTEIEGVKSTVSDIQNAMDTLIFEPVIGELANVNTAVAETTAGFKDWQNELDLVKQHVQEFNNIANEIRLEQLTTELTQTQNSLAIIKTELEGIKASKNNLPPITNKWSSAIGRAKGLLLATAAVLGVKGILGQLRGGVYAMQEEVAIRARLQIQLANMATTQAEYLALTERAVATANRLQQETAIGASTWLQAQATLSMFMDDLDKTESLMRSLGDLAAGVTGNLAIGAYEMKDMAKMIGQAVQNGRMGPRFLRMQGVILSEMEEAAFYYANQMERVEMITNAINRAYGGMADTLYEHMGGMQQFQNILGDIRIELGAMLIPFINTVQGALVPLLERVQGLLEGKRARLAYDTQGAKGAILGLAAAFAFLGVVATRAFAIKHKNFLKTQIDALKTAAVKVAVFATSWNKIAWAALKATGTQIKAFLASKAAAIASAAATAKAFIASNAAIAKSGAFTFVGMIKKMGLLGLQSLKTGAKMLLAFAKAVLPLLILIGVVVGIIKVFKHLGVTVKDIFAFIGGVISTAVAVIENLFFGMVEMIFAAINFLVNPFITFANFIGNLFENTVSSIINLFHGMADNILGILEGVARAIDRVFGGNLAAAVGSWRDGIAGIASDMIAQHAPDENYREIVSQLNLELTRERRNYREAFTAGQEAGRAAYGRLDSFLNGWANFTPDSIAEGFDFSDFGMDLDKYATANGNALRVAQTEPLRISGENMRLLHDIATARYSVNYRSLSPNITLNAEIHNQGDEKRLLENLADWVEDACFTSLEVNTGINYGTRG
ncbi:MAG: hypothetical protein FWG63_02530 [Defluviitaleaceae bacterium]|nr:hypothetical protein [Defluviitaleaceae bacterium]